MSQGHRTRRETCAGTALAPHRPDGPGEAGGSPGGLGAVPEERPAGPRRLVRLRRAVPVPRQRGRIPAQPHGALESASARPPTPSWPSGPRGPACSCPPRGRNSNRRSPWPTAPSRWARTTRTTASSWRPRRWPSTGSAGSRAPSTGARRPAPRVPGCPRSSVLAMAHQQLGHATEARRSLDEAVKTYDWKSRDGIIHALRREAEQLIKNGPEGKTREPENNPD